MSQLIFLTAILFLRSINSSLSLIFFTIHTDFDHQHVESKFQILKFRYLELRYFRNAKCPCGVLMLLIPLGVLTIICIPAPSMPGCDSTIYVGAKFKIISPHFF